LINGQNHRMELDPEAVVTAAADAGVDVIVHLRRHRRKQATSRRRARDGLRAAYWKPIWPDRRPSVGSADPPLNSSSICS
jgi:hypothetical protein